MRRIRGVQTDFTLPQVSLEESYYERESRKHSTEIVTVLAISVVFALVGFGLSLIPTPVLTILAWILGIFAGCLILI